MIKPSPENYELRRKISLMMAYAAEFVEVEWSDDGNYWSDLSTPSWDWRIVDCRAKHNAFFPVIGEEYLFWNNDKDESFLDIFIGYNVHSEFPFASEYQNNRNCAPAEAKKLGQQK